MSKNAGESNEERRKRKRAIADAALAVALATPRTGKGPTVYTHRESAHHAAVVEELLKQGLSSNQILARVRKPAPDGIGIGTERARRIIGRVLEQWQADDAGKRAQWKSAQIRRLTEMIQVARGRMGPDGQWQRKPDHSAVVRYENLLADIQGTREPIQVNVDVRYTEAMMLVIGGMDPDDMKTLIDEAARAEELARRYEREHPELAAEVVEAIG